MSGTRENWTSRSGFIIAAVGSAVGLGNIWRFPYVAYENGGGAFLIPYLLALITAGLPLLFLDYATGHRSSGSPPKAYRALFKGGETLGWWQVCVCIIIGLYYASVLTWAGSYVYFSIGQAWGSDPESFFFNTYLQTSKATGFDFQFDKNVKSNVFMRGINSFSVLYIDYLSRLGVDAESSNFMQENKRNKSFQKVC